MEGDAMSVGGETSCRKESELSSVCTFKAVPVKVSVFLPGASGYFSFTRKNRIKEMLTYYIEPLMYRKYHKQRNKFSHVTGTQLAKSRLQEAWRTT